jgi:hypothetical protein
MDEFEEMMNMAMDSLHMADVSLPKRDLSKPYAIEAPPQVTVPGYEDVAQETAGMTDVQLQDRMYEKAEVEGMYTPPITVAMLKNDPTMAAASRDVYQLFEGKPFEGSDADVVQYGIDVMGEFTFNFAGPVGIQLSGGQSSPGGTLKQAAALIGQGDANKAQAFLYVMDQYDRLGVEAEGGFSRMFKGLVADPSNWAAAVTLGGSKILQMGGQTATKQGIKYQIRQLAKNATTAVAARPAIAAGIGEMFRSGITEERIIGIEEEAGAEIVPEEKAARIGIASAIGGLTGAGFVKGAETVGKGLKAGIEETVMPGVRDFVEGAEGRVLAREADTSVQLNAGFDPTAVADRVIVGLKKIRGEEATNLPQEQLTAIKNAAPDDDQAGFAVDVAEKTFARFPESDGWMKPEINISSPKNPPFKINNKGEVEINWKETPYNFHMPPEGVTKEQHATNLSSSMVDEVAALVSRAQSGDQAAQDIVRQATWYRSMRSKLREQYGGLGDTFADLLGATSAQTGVQQNYENAAIILKKYSQGDYDEAISMFQKKVDAGESLSGVDLTRAHKDPNNPFYLIAKDTNALFNANSPAATKALLDMFRQVKAGQSPKTINFTGNLIGYGTNATVDVWAARNLRRLAGLPRIPTVNEKGVGGMHLAKSTLDDPRVGGEFGFGQDVFSQAADQINSLGIVKSYDPALGDLGDDDLQALVWFMEKEIWTEKGWTSKAGEGGSFDYEAGLSGSSNPERVKKLRSIITSKNSTPEAVAAAQDELNRIGSPPVRYTAGISMQRPGKKPTNIQQALLSEKITEPLKDDPTVLGYQANNTYGMFAGDAERSLNYEIVARQNFDPEKATQALVEAGRANDQDSVFLSKIVAPDTPNANPGIEIYFDARKDPDFAKKIEQVLRDKEIDGVTFITDARVSDRPMEQIVTGEETAGLTGIRFQYIPEFDPEFLPENAAKILEDKADEYLQVVKELSNFEGISYADLTYYDTKVFKNTDRSGTEWINGGTSYEEYLGKNASETAQ